MEKVFDKSIFDTNVEPGDDFNKYVNGKWEENNEIPKKYSRWGTFEIIHESNLKKLQNVILNSNGEYQILKSLYDEYMNLDKINQLDKFPINNFIIEIELCNNKDDLWKLISRYYRSGLTGLVHFYSSEDAKNSEYVVPQFATGGLNLPERGYYFDDEKKETRSKYLKYLNDVWKLYFNKEEDMKIVLDLETKLAETTYTRLEKRDPEKRYNKYTLDELNKLSNLDWKYFISQLTSKEISYLIIDNPEFYKKLEIIWNETSLQNWKTYFKMNIIVKLSSYIHEGFYNLKFNFFSKYLKGQKEPKPRWERAISIVDSYIGDLLGKNYASKFFPEESKNKMLKLVKNLHLALEERIQNLSWMSSKTKEKALLKHKAFKFKIGYPDKWRDFSKINFNNNFNLVDMIVHLNQFNYDYEIDKIYKNSDKDEWEMNAHTINAYFHPLKNEIVFPAGILQFPFFDPNMDDAFNYGGIGAVIGHEMTHSFDDMGSKFDENGNLNNWWTEGDKEKFMKKAEYYVKEYDNNEINGNNVNGKLTLGENLADHGGVKIAYHALQKVLPENTLKIDNLTPNERFFLAWAYIWKSNLTDEKLDEMIRTDPHSPPMFRINSVLANIPEFHKTFNVNSNHKMFRENPVQIW